MHGAADDGGGVAGSDADGSQSERMRVNEPHSCSAPMSDEWCNNLGPFTPLLPLDTL